MKYYMILYFMTVVCLSGFGRVGTWAKQSFNQGEHTKEFGGAADCAFRTIKIYDQFTLKGAFDVLWLSDDVRTEYASLYAFKRAKSHDSYKTFLRRQLEENHHFVTFYVLSWHYIPLGTKESEWSLFLRVGGTNYVPMEIKRVELPFEYSSFFNNHYSKFRDAYQLKKDVYQVKFDAKDIEGNYVIGPKEDLFELVFRSAKKEDKVCWHVNANGEVVMAQKKPVIGERVRR